MKTLQRTLGLRYPASWWSARWRDALPSGNGSIGAAVYGGICEETILLTHADLWDSSRTPDLPDVSDQLPRVRQLLQENRPEEADRVLSEALRAHGYNPSLATPLPLADLKVIMPGRQAFRQYGRELDMQTGEVTVRWRDGRTSYERTLFVSRVADMVVYEIRAAGPETIDCRLYLERHDPSDGRPPDGRSVRLPGDVRCGANGEYLLYAARNDDGTDFGAVARVVTRDGKVASRNDGVEVIGASNVLVYVRLFVKSRREEAWRRLQTELALVKADYAELLLPHAAEHGRLFGAMTLNLAVAPDDYSLSNEELLLEAYQGQAPTMLVEKMWAYGRYLLISSSRSGGQPCPLMGLWCGEYQGLWAYNMANENLQMIYWQALKGNLSELLLPVFEYYERRMDDFRTNARRLFGCRGILIPANTAPDSGLLKDLQPHIIHWTGAAGWIAAHFFDYYQYSGDREFLRQRALPFLREVALFYEDFFTIGPDGFFISSPSNSPENTPGNYWNRRGKNKDMSTAVNATMDFAIAKEVLTHLVEGSRQVDLYANEVPKWEVMLGRIPPYQINEDGAIREWMHPHFTDNYHHRHQSHIYPVFPGTEVTREDSPELFEAFATAVKKRLVIGLKEQSGWSLAHLANTYARMGEGDLALECLEILSRSCLLNNFFTTHNDWRNMGIGVDMEWAPFQIDANMGWAAAIQEMLLFSRPGLVRLLPAVPARWRRGHFRGMLCRGGIEVSAAWDLDDQTLEVAFLSRVDQTVAVEFPGSLPALECAPHGSLLENASKSVNRLTLRLAAGQVTTCKVKLVRDGQRYRSSGKGLRSFGVLQEGAEEPMA